MLKKAGFILFWTLLVAYFIWLFASWHEITAQNTEPNEVKISEWNWFKAVEDVVRGWTDEHGYIEW